MHNSIPSVDDWSLGTCYCQIGLVLRGVLITASYEFQRINISSIRSIVLLVPSFTLGYSVFIILCTSNDGFSSDI